MTKEEMNALKDKAARVLIKTDMVFIEIWNNDEEWETLEAYPIVRGNLHYSCIVRIMQMIEMKFTFEPFLIG